MTVEKRESLPIGTGKRRPCDRAPGYPGRTHPQMAADRVDRRPDRAGFAGNAGDDAGAYPDEVIRTSLTSLTTRAHVPAEEQLMMVPFKVGELAGMRLVRVVPGVAAQFTDGAQDTLEATEQSHLLIAAAAGGPAESRDRDQFARDAMSGLPPFKDLRLINAEPMRIGGQPGHEVRAQAKDPQTGADIEIVQWLRFGTGAYLRILGFGPKDKWTETFTRFRAIRDGLEPRVSSQSPLDLVLRSQPKPKAKAGVSKDGPRVAAHASRRRASRGSSA